MLDWAALNAVSIACTHGDFLSRRSGRHDNAAAGREYDVRAAGLGEPWRGLEEFLGVHMNLDGESGAIFTLIQGQSIFNI